MSDIKREWEAAIQSSDDPRETFFDFFMNTSEESNWLHFSANKRTYLPGDASRQECQRIIEEMKKSISYDEAINNEYHYQTMIWPQAYDDLKSDIEWQHLIAGRIHTPGIEFEARMIQIAALAKSALMAFDRKKSERVLDL